MNDPLVVERVTALTGPDRETDARLWWKFDHNAAVRAYWNASTGTPQEMDPNDFIRSRGLGYGYVLRSAPAFTGSTDAALALMAKLLPEWAVADMSEDYSAPPKNTIGWTVEIENMRGTSVQAMGPTLPLAIVSATLTALSSQEASK